jgi:hypothetical protein
MTDREALEALVETWRANASQSSMMQSDSFNARCETYAKCADELEEVLEE